MRQSFSPLASLLATAALLLASPVGAQSATDHSAGGDTLPTIDPRVDGLVQGGYWVQGAVHGRYRIVVIREGWETIRRRAFVQWLTEPDDPEAPTRIRATLELTPLTDLFALAEPTLERVSMRWVVTLRGARRPMGGYTERARFVLGPPGEARLAPGR